MILGQIGGWIKSWKVEKSCMNQALVTWIEWMFKWFILIVMEMKLC